MDWHLGVVTTVAGLDRYYHDLLERNVSFHSHAKQAGYDTLHAVGPAAFSVELNGEFESSLLSTDNAFDWCTWDTESASSIPPDFEACTARSRAPRARSPAARPL